MPQAKDFTCNLSALRTVQRLVPQKQIGRMFVDNSIMILTVDRLPFIENLRKVSDGYLPVISVPMFSPQTARTMLSGSVSPKARMGISFSIHMVMAVTSMAFKPR